MGLEVDQGLKKGRHNNEKLYFGAEFLYKKETFQEKGRVHTFHPPPPPNRSFHVGLRVGSVGRSKLELSLEEGLRVESRGRSLSLV